MVTPWNFLILIIFSIITELLFVLGLYQPGGIRNVNIDSIKRSELLAWLSLFDIGSLTRGSIFHCWLLF